MSHAANVKTDLPAFEKFGRTITPGDDPTKTGGLRARWVAQVNKRWAEVQRFVTTSVVAEDFFGLRRDTPPGNPSQQIERFMAALVRVEGTTINEEKGGFIPWITPFVGEGFSKGMIRGNRDLAALARGQRREAATNAVRLVTNAEPALFEAPTLDPNNIQDALQAGERARLFEMEVTRTWQGITGVTAATNAQIAQAIATGLETRATPRQMAKSINDRIGAVGITRASMIARTETVAANNRGAVAEFAEAQRLTGFEVHVQWETSLDSRVRDTHIVRHGDVYTKEAGLGLISEPNCRCALLPYIPAIEGKVDLSSGKAAKALTPKEAEARAERERKKLQLPKGQVGTPVKRRAKPSQPKKPKTKAPKSLNGQLDNMFAAMPIDEKAQTRLAGIFKKAPDNVKKAVLGTPKLRELTRKPGGSYHLGSRINMSNDQTRVYVHEYGHHVLENAGQGPNKAGTFAERFAMWERYDDAFQKETAKLSRRGKAKALYLEEMRGKVYARKFVKDADGNDILDADFMDFWGALTKNKIGFGHSTSYYTQRGGKLINVGLNGQHHESFADMLTLYYREDRSQWNFVRENAPDLTAAFLALLDDVGGLAL